MSPLRAPATRRAGAPATLAASLLCSLLSAAVAAETIDTALAEAARTARAGGFAEARRRFEPALTALGPADAARGRTLLGLLASLHGETDAALALLGDEAPPEIEDWRLFALAEARAARGDAAAARAALEALVALHPDSPLRPQALVREVQLAAGARDAAAVRERVASARAENLPEPLAVEVERLAWQAGIETGDVPLLGAAARRLLVLAPLEASRLQVVDVLAERDPRRSDWRLLLSDGELLERAAALVEVELPAGALTTLAAIAEERRGLAWRLLEARALAAAGRGAEAYETLRRARAGNAAERTALEWQRALAAGEAARPRRGPAHAAETEQRWRGTAREHLLAVVRSGGDTALAAQALERLANEDLERGRLAEAVAALRQLQALAPHSTAGARALWELGWEAYAAARLERAIAAWRDLVSLYPATSSARPARYWTARALERQGDAEAARRLYLELLAADTADLYARQSALRLAGATPQFATPPVEREAWPEDARLARARYFSEVGLERLARQELELLADLADPRAAAALRARLLAQAGERRASLSELKRAFPDLGTAHQASVPETALALYYPRDFDGAIARAAAEEGLPPALVYGIVHQESAFDAAARSRSGARGLMQIMPATGRELARRLRLPFSLARLETPDYSLRLGTRYVRQLLDQFDGRVELALAGYNGGPGRISRLWRAAGPAPELDLFLEGLAVTESRNYVKRILVLFESYRSLYSDLG